MKFQDGTLKAGARYLAALEKRAGCYVSVVLNDVGCWEVQ